MSSKFFRKILIGQSGLIDIPDFVEKYSLPTTKDSLVLLSPGSASGKHVTFDGPLTFSAIDQFLSKYVNSSDWEKIDL